MGLGEKGFLWYNRKRTSKGECAMLFLCYPKCTTCQKAQAWLDAQGVAYTLRHIRDDCPTQAELALWQQMSGLPLKRFFNASGLSYKRLGLKERLADMPQQEQLALLAGDGMLVRRPILVGDGFVLVGFRQAEWEKALA